MNFSRGFLDYTSTKAPPQITSDMILSIAQIECTLDQTVQAISHLDHTIDKIFERLNVPTTILLSGIGMGAAFVGLGVGYVLFRSSRTKEIICVQDAPPKPACYP